MNFRNKKSWLINIKSTFRIILIVLLFSGSFSCQKDVAEQITETPEPPPLPPVPKTDKPNIVLIVGDDVGYEIPNYTGGQSYSTPNLNFLAANGIQFTQCFGYPDGFPSRLALYTGKYNFRNYIRWGHIPEGEKTVANMLQDAGYATCFVGKWQCGDGDEGLRRNGFENYRVFLPFPDDQRVRRYKFPLLYEKGAYLPDDAVRGRYSEDLFVDYLSDFIDSNRTKSFFAVYSLNLVAQPWVPTPDNAEFKNWDPNKDQAKSDIKYFPGMVKYMDKKIGEVVNKIINLGLQQNTIILFTADNATDTRVTSVFNGQTVTGSKTTTVKRGNNMPFLAYWPNTIAAASVSSEMIAFTDFLPTFADIANIARPVTYGTLDGITFYDNLTGVPGENRDWVFCDWDNDHNDEVPEERYVYNRQYKLYDSTGERKTNFYDMVADPNEIHAIPDANLTPEQQQMKQEFLSILSQMH